MLPLSNAWLRAAELITSAEPAALEEARRYCRAEARDAGRDAEWLWVRLEWTAEARL